jgi:hypothetical protein
MVQLGSYLCICRVIVCGISCQVGNCCIWVGYYVTMAVE